MPTLVNLELDVPVADPLLWNTTTPKLYQLVANLRVGDIAAPFTPCSGSCD